MVFWILVTLMILAVLALLLRPLLRGAPPFVPGEDRLNRSVYRQQIQELESDLDRGLVTDEQMEQARMDIERALLEEVPEASQNRQGENTQRGRLPVMLAAVLIIAASVPLYLYIGYPGVPAGGGTAAATPDGAMPSVQEMVASLERRLQRDPDDPEGWLMLARSYTVLGRYGEAAGALERLRGMVGDEPGLLVRYANALAMANNGRFEGRPAALIQQVLEQDPDNPSAIWFAGLAANQRGDYREAIDYWERLVPALQGEPEALQRLQQMIDQARAAQGIGTAEQAGAPRPEAAAADEAAGVTVRVSLAPGLRDSVQPDDSLFIFARAVGGGTGMPLAVVRRRAGDLPLEIRLDDSDAMTPAGRLSRHDAVTLVARISRSGQPQATSGDLQGSQARVGLPAGAPVDLVIDTTVR
jgi:cytochrome c-type biogenesis protein CcmH